jgi:hypothetical protein
MVKYKIIAVENILEHKSDILSLWKRNLYDCPERFAWLYEQNPLGTALTWLAVREDTGEAVGCSSLYPCLFHVNGKTIKVGTVVDYGVDEKHRVFGPAISIIKAITTYLKTTNNEFNISFGYPSRIATAAIQRGGYKLIGASNYWVKILRSEYKIAKYIKVKFPSHVIGLMIDLVLSFLDTMRTTPCSEELEIETVDSCDERFDALWENSKSQYKIVPFKNKEYLNWRYSQCRTRKYRYFCLCDKKDKSLKGYIMYSILDNEANIKDIFPVHTEYLQHLLLMFSRQMRKDNMFCITLSYYGNEYIEKTLKKLTYFKGELKRDYVIYIKENTDAGIRDALLNKDNYSLFFG